MAGHRFGKLVHLLARSVLLQHIFNLVFVVIPGQIRIRQLHDQIAIGRFEPCPAVLLDNADDRRSEGFFQHGAGHIFSQCLS